MKIQFGGAQVSLRDNCSHWGLKLAFALGSTKKRGEGKNIESGN